MAAKQQRQILIEIDGPQADPDLIDSRAALAFFAAYVDLLAAAGEHNDVDLKIHGLEVVRKCTAIRVHVANVASALTIARRTREWVKDPASAPRGLGQPAQRAHAARLGLRAGLTTAVRSASSERGQVTIEAAANAATKVREHTEVRATVVRAGGDETPVVELRIEPDGRVVKFDVDRAIAADMGKRLYAALDAEVTLERDDELVPLRGSIHHYEWVAASLSIDDQVAKFMSWLSGPGYDA